jgi:hypothetical protein
MEPIGLKGNPAHQMMVAMTLSMLKDQARLVSMAQTMTMTDLRIVMTQTVPRESNVNSTKLNLNEERGHYWPRFFMSKLHITADMSDSLKQKRPIHYLLFYGIFIFYIRHRQL